MASIDVVVPCYNYAKYLPGCIASILSQEGVDVRALIIDDASTDDTPAVGTELARNDSRIEYRRHAQNMRHIATYNEGLIGWATADYSLLLSADDLLAPGSLQRATAVMEQRADVHMTYGMALLFFKDEDVQDSPVNAQIPETSIPAFRTVAGPAFIRRSIEGNPVPTPAAIVRTRVQQRIGGYSASLPHTADMEMWMRFAACGSIGVVPFVQAYKRMHNANMSIQYYDRPLGDFRERVEACRELLAAHGSAMGNAAPSIEEVNQQFALQVFWSASGYAEKGHADACDQALQFAQELWPSLRHSPAWRRLKAKRIIPAALWRLLQPSIDRLRGQSSQRGAAGAATWVARQQIGWWPEQEAHADR